MQGEILGQSGEWVQLLLVGGGKKVRTRAYGGWQRALRSSECLQMGKVYGAEVK